MTLNVSSSQPSPHDLYLCVSVTGAKTEHPITSMKKARKKYACQVFYCKEGFNWWNAKIVFCPKYLVDVS